MSLKEIIRESLNNNPMGLKEAFAAELGQRLVKLFSVSEETDLDEGHGVFRKGGSIGEKPSTKPIKIHDNIEDAKKQAKNFNDQLSAGEKGVYKIKYHVKPVSEEIDLGGNIDQIDEVSKEKLLNYIGNASVSKSHASHQIGKINQKRMDGTVSHDDTVVQAGANAIHGNRSGGIQLAAAKLAGKYADNYPVKIKATEETDLDESIISYSAEYIKEKLKSNDWELIHGQMLPNKPFNIKNKSNGKVSTIMYRA